MSKSDDSGYCVRGSAVWRVSSRPPLRLPAVLSCTSGCSRPARAVLRTTVCAVLREDRRAHADASFTGLPRSDSSNPSMLLQLLALVLGFVAPPPTARDELVARIADADVVRTDRRRSTRATSQSAWSPTWCRGVRLFPEVVEVHYHATSLGLQALGARQLARRAEQEARVRPPVSASSASLPASALTHELL